MKRLLKWLLIFLLVLVIVVLALGYYFTGTDRGFRMLTNEINQQVDGLQTGSISGNLATGVKTDTLKFENENIIIHANRIDSSWRSRCLLGRRLCIDQVVIDELYIEPQSTNKQPAQSSLDDLILPSIDLPLNINIRDVLIKKLRFKPPGGQAEQVVNDITLSVSNENNQVEINGLSARYKNFTVSTKGKVKLADDYPLDLEVKLMATNLVDEQDVLANIQLSNSLAELNLNAVLSGSVSATISGQIDPLKKKLPVKLRITSDLLGWPLDTHETVKAEQISVQVDGDIDDYKLRLVAQLSGDQLPASALTINGVVNQNRALLTDVTVLSLGGFATGSAAVSWTDNIIWLTEMIIKDMNPAVHFADIDGKLQGLLRANGTVENDRWTLNIDQGLVNGVLRNYPFTLDTKVQKKLDDEWVLHSFYLDNGENQISANGTVGDVWDIKAKAQLPQLQNLWPGLAGGFNAAANVTGELSNPNIDLQANSALVKFDDVLIRGMSLNTEINRAARDASNLQLAIGKINVGTQQITNTRLQLNGNREKHSIKLFADGPQKTSIDLVASGALDDQFDWLGSLRSVELEVPAHKIHLRQPTELSWRNDVRKFSVDAHCWAAQDTSLCLNNKVLAESNGQASISLTGYALRGMNPFLPADSTLTGLLTAESTIQWGKDQPAGFQATLDTSITNGGFKVVDQDNNTLKFNYENLTLKSTISPVDIYAKLDVNSRSLGKASVNVNLDPATANKDIDGELSLAGFDIGFLKAFLPQLDEISGTLNAQGKIGGSLVDPDFNGEVVLDSPVIRAAILPLSIDGGRISSAIKGKQATVDGALQSGDGAIGVSGSASWDRKIWRANLRLDGENLSIAQDPITDSNVFTKLDIKLRPGSVEVRGNVDIPYARINIRDLPKGATTLSDDVTIIEEVQAQASKQSESRERAMDVGLKVNVSLGDDVKLSGYGLKAGLNGDIRLTLKSPTPPQLGGELHIVDGIYQQYGQNLKVSDGQILFVGPIDQTRLNIDAVREIDGEDRVAGMHLTGPIANPEITLFTEPADKSQEAILSYIVLGRDIGDTSDQESNLLASAALALTLKSGRGYADNIAESLGIKDFTLDARGRGNDTEVVLSGRVSDRLLLRYGRSVFEPESTLYLRYDITRQLYLEAAQGLERAVDLFYSFSF